ncbi:MAG TPA: DUF4367 domain-containing protein [Anaerolineae bacterium]
MNEQLFDKWEQRLQTTAAAFAYPPTPDVAGAVTRRLRQQRATRDTRSLMSGPRLAWAMALLLLLLGGLMAVPQVRAAVLQLLRVGAVTIFVTEPTPTTTTTPTSMPATSLPGLAESTAATTTPTAMATALPSPAALTSSLHDIAGTTTLAEAQAQFDFPLRLPTYPPGLGLPDRVFHQELPNSVVMLVWLKPDQQEVRLALYLIEGQDFAIKKVAETMQETFVNGNVAVWVEGEHLLQLQDDTFQPWYFVEGNVLVWFDGRVTYRLETGLSLEEAVRIAESLEATRALEEE